MGKTWLETEFYDFPLNCVCVCGGGLVKYTNHRVGKRVLYPKSMDVPRLSQILGHLAEVKNLHMEKILCLFFHQFLQEPGDHALPPCNCPKPS